MLSDIKLPNWARLGMQGALTNGKQKRKKKSRETPVIPAGGEFWRALDWGFSSVPFGSFPRLLFFTFWIGTKIRRLP